MDRPTIPLLRKTILVVEPDAPARKEMARMLGIEGYIVLEAADGVSALRLIQNLRPDLILAAVNPPPQDGLEFFSTVRQNPSWTAIPFIFLVPPQLPEMTQISRDLGAEDFLRKPLDAYQLIKTVGARLLRAAEVRIALNNQAYLDTVNVLANAIELRDPYTFDHIDRVAGYARGLAEALQWPEDQLRNLEYGARLHDIGKIIVPDSILNKPGNLVNEEWEIMKRHPEAGAKMVRKIRYLQAALPYVLYHHERWDGSGYPFGLAGREIPIEGRLMALADVYDALTTNRSYHPACTEQDALQFIVARSSVLFDPDLVPIFLESLKNRRSTTDIVFQP